ncbi:MAG TPA: SMP-30/gluconolactonase/LRE family protein [Thermoanaerobaculia bacterium]
MNIKKLAAALGMALGLVLLPASGLLAHAPDAPSLETVASFNPAALETPESIAIDLDGNRYISLVMTGEIRKIAPDGSQSTFALLPIGPPLSICGPFFNGVAGITIDVHGTVYASVLACDPDKRGIWKITQDGEAEILATLPMGALPNGIALYRGDLYAADSFMGRIWRVPAEGGTAEVWSDDPSLAPPPPHPVLGPLPGANGLQVFRKEIYVANSGTSEILAFPVEPDGSAGAPRVHAVLPGGQGCDDFAFDVRGNIYCTTDPFLTVVKIAPDGSSEIILTAADGLDGPTAASFGRTGQDRFNLYITNAAFPFFSTTHQPSLMRLHLDVPGEPPAW